MFRDQIYELQTKFTVMYMPGPVTVTKWPNLAQSTAPTIGYSHVQTVLVGLHIRATIVHVHREEIDLHIYFYYIFIICPAKEPHVEFSLKNVKFRERLAIVVKTEIQL